MTSHSASPNRSRTAAKWLGIGLFLIVTALAALYALTPTLVEHFAPTSADRFGLKTLTLDIGRPGARELEIRQLRASTDGFELSAESALVQYSLPMLFKGQLESLIIDRLEVMVLPGTPSGASENSTPIDQLLLAPPIELLEAKRLDISVPETGFIGTGNASLGNGVLSFVLNGVAPDAASRFAMQASITKDGVFDARFADREAQGQEFLQLDGAIEPPSIYVGGQIRLSGFALDLASAILGLPAGAGQIEASVSTTLPWPLPEVIDWQSVHAAVPSYSVDWHADSGALRIDGVSGRAQVTATRVSGNVSGAIDWNSPEFNVNVELPPDYHFRFTDNVLHLANGAITTLETTGSSISTTLNSLALSTSLPRRLDLDTKVVAMVGTAEINGRVTGNVDLSNIGALRADGRFQFNGQARAGERPLDGALAAEFSLSGENLNLSGDIDVLPLEDIAFAFQYSLNSGAGTLNAEDRHTLERPLLASLFPERPSNFDLDGGDTDAALQLSWQTLEDIEADVAIALTGGNAHFEKDTASGIEGAFRLRSEDANELETWTLLPTTVSVKQVDAGLLLDDLQVQLSWQDSRLRVQDFQARVLGGSARVDSFNYLPTDGNAHFELMLQDLELSQILALEGDDITGSGRLDGVLPITIVNNETSVENGTLMSKPPGGRIQLSPSFSGSGAQVGLDFALRALQDFAYSELTANVDYQPNGDLLLGVALKGRNPEIEGGRPIHYNVNISENIPVLLESLRLQDRVTEYIEKGAN